MMVFIDTLFRFLRIVKLFTVIITRGPYRAIQVNAGSTVRAMTGYINYPLGPEHLFARQARNRTPCSH